MFLSVLKQKFKYKGELLYKKSVGRLDIGYPITDSFAVNITKEQVCPYFGEFTINARVPLE